MLKELLMTAERFADNTQTECAKKLNEFGLKSKHVCFDIVYEYIVNGIEKALKTAEDALNSESNDEKVEAVCSLLFIGGCATDIPLRTEFWGRGVDCYLRRLQHKEASEEEFKKVTKLLNALI